MKFSPWISVLVVVGASSPAWGDILFPDEEACIGKRVGDTCVVDAGGASDCTACECQDSTCQRTIYFCPDGGEDAGDAADAAPGANCYRDASSEPCVRCLSAAAIPDSGMNAPDSQFDATSGGEVDATLDAPSVPAEGSPETSAGGAESSGGCSCRTSPASAWRAVAPWLLAALVSLVLRRRRTRG